MTRSLQKNQLKRSNVLASLLVTTEAVVAEKPKKEQPGPQMTPEY